ncbi:hypothetical protein B7P43_G18102 [Cryptotermes secundus]|uniref:Endonuclease/exonuclease/phosphatase domain-containing protein n=1 Tax=Cryptotermes secundus TaxID=105785 RepID=A0A2J7PPB8_9NEOP|nr:hypothetical protein B7P43_G18102 [Cryptotermes secundus]
MDVAGFLCVSLCNVRSMYRAGSIRAVAEEILKYKLDVAGVQEVRWDGWDGGGIAPAGEYTFFYEKGNGTRFFIHTRISTVKRVLFVSDRINLKNEVNADKNRLLLAPAARYSVRAGTDHYLVVAKVRERLAVSKQSTHRVHTERCNLKKLNEVEGKEQYRVEISNSFAALENLDIEVDVNKAWETITENINISDKESLGYYELKKHKPRFDEG